MQLAWLVSKKLACFHVAFMKYIEKGKASALTWSNKCWKTFLFVKQNLEVTIKISSRANTNKIEKITSLKFLCSNVNVSVKNIWKVAWARGSEAFAPTFTLWLEAEKKAVEASYFEISVLRKWTFLKLPCVVVWDIEK